ncbi:hypothetical protein TNCV_3303311 [Trichonephila clavipes]|nr:hypothetical protein TNCV_3303311 [Trichonephila clavipes]
MRRGSHSGQGPWARVKFLLSHMDKRTVLWKRIFFRLNGSTFYVDAISGSSSTKEIEKEKDIFFRPQKTKP